MGYLSFCIDTLLTNIFYPPKNRLRFNHRNSFIFCRVNTVIYIQYANENYSNFTRVVWLIFINMFSSMHTICFFKYLLI